MFFNSIASVLIFTLVISLVNSLKVQLDEQGVDRVCPAIRELLLNILQVVLSRGEQLAEVNALLAGAGVEGGRAIGLGLPWYGGT